ncbi:MAG: porin [Deltaproteobacteria bacterium]|nr:porin [Deltaproteobacteria bacterium]
MSAAPLNLITVMLLSGETTRAQEVLPGAAPAPVAPAPPPPALPEWLDGVTLHGFVDTYFAVNSNRPADGANFLPGTGSTGKRFNEFTLNLAALDVAVEKGPVLGRLTLAFGNGIEVLHAGEPRGIATGPDVLRNVLTASVGYAAPFVRGLTVEAGKFPSHVGLEVMASKDNWNYTRAWSGEYSPYYSAGLKVSYAFPRYVTVTGLLLNGWQVTGENNLFKSVGTQVAWNSERLVLSWGTLLGSELPGARNTLTGWQSPYLDTRVRFFNDLVVVLKPTPHVNLGAQVDVGYQQADKDKHQVWAAAGAYLRLLQWEKLAFAFRLETFLDPFNAISGFEQWLTGATATVELMPAPFLSLKLEARSDYSSVPAFGTAETTDDGTVIGTRTQNLLVGGAVVYF